MPKDSRQNGIERVSGAAVFFLKTKNSWSPYSLLQVSDGSRTILWRLSIHERQIEEEENLSKNQEETLKSTYQKYEMMDNVLNGSTSGHLADYYNKIRNEKARRYLNNMKKKPPVPFTQKFPNVDPQALRLLERLLAFDPRDRPTAAQALADPYFNGLVQAENEPSAQPIAKLEFAFERKKLRKEDVRELIYREILEYHPKMLAEYLDGSGETNFLYPSGVDRFKQQFAHLEEHTSKGGKVALNKKQVSMPRERVNTPEAKTGVLAAIAEANSPKHNLRKSDSISASRCIAVPNTQENLSSQ